MIIVVTIHKGHIASSVDFFLRSTTSIVSEILFPGLVRERLIPEYVV